MESDLAMASEKLAQEAELSNSMCHFAATTNAAATTIEVCDNARHLAGGKNEFYAFNETAVKQGEGECLNGAKCSVGSPSEKGIRAVIPEDVVEKAVRNTAGGGNSQSHGGNSDDDDDGEKKEMSLTVSTLTPVDDLASRRRMRKLVYEENKELFQGRKLEEVERDSELQGVFARKLKEKMDLHGFDSEIFSGENVNNYKRVLNSNTARSAYDSSCYTKVRKSESNTAYLVGQTIGDCATVDNSNTGSEPVQVCLAVNTKIKTNTAFSEYKIAKRSATIDSTLDDYIYSVHEQKTGTSVASSGDQLCAEVPIPQTAGELLCPARVIPSYASASANAATASCEALENQIRLVSQSAQSVGGKRIDGTNTYTPPKASANSINPVISDEVYAQMRKVQAKAQMGMSAPAGTTKEMIEGNSKLIKSLLTGVENAVNIPGAVVEYVAFSATVSRTVRSLTSSEASKSISKNLSKRRVLSTVTVTMVLDYKVLLPSTTTNLDAVASTLGQQLSSGGAGSQAFAAALQQSIQAAVSTSLTGFTVTGVTQQGTVTVVVETDNSALSIVDTNNAANNNNSGLGNMFTLSISEEDLPIILGAVGGGMVGLCCICVILAKLCGGGGQKNTQKNTKGTRGGDKYSKNKIAGEEDDGIEMEEGPVKGKK